MATENAGARIKELIAEWREETQRVPSASNVADHPSYRNIVAMGKEAIPHLLSELQENPWAGFMAALHEITGENPVREADAGNLKSMAASWIHWGKREGHLPPEPPKTPCSCPPQ